MELPIRLCKKMKVLPIAEGHKWLYELHSYNDEPIVLEYEKASIALPSEKESNSWQETLRFISNSKYDQIS